MFLKIFIVGWAILIIAILVNLVASRLGIDTWYPFISEMGKVGVMKAFLKISFVSKVFLFVVYPLLLGLIAFVVLRSIK